MVSALWFTRLFRAGGAAADAAKVGVAGAKSAKVAAFIGELPVVRIIAGSAVGVVIIDAWNNSTRSISGMLGVSEETSSLLLGIGLVGCIALIASAIISMRRR